MENIEQPLTVNAAYSKAVEHFNAGRYTQADQLCTAIINASPNHVDAINLLGVVAQRVNRHDLAVEQFRRAINIDSSRGLLYFNLGSSLYPLGRREEAVEALKTALEKEPGNSQIGNYLNAVLNRETDSAEDALKQAINCHQSGRLNEAVVNYQKAIYLEADYPQAHCNYGVCLKELGRFDEAVASYQRAIAIADDYADAHYNLANIMRDLGRFDEAVASYQRTIAIADDYADAHYNLANIYMDQERLDDAVLSYQKALTIKPDYAKAYSNLGNTFKKQDKLAEATICYQKAISIQADFVEAHSNLGNILQDQGKIAQGVASHKKALAIKPEHLEARSNYLLGLHYGECSREELFNEHKVCNLYYGKKHHRSTSNHKRAGDAEKPLIIGFVSGDFKRHSVSYFLQPLFAAYNREKIAIHCYSNLHHEDDITHLLRQQVKGWHNIAGKSDQEVIDLIKSDRIDILVDLSGHTKYNRLTLFAQKPAPIQVTWLGYPDTTGLTAIDYRISDPIADPHGESDNYCVERLVRLADGFLCYQPPVDTPDILPTPMLVNGHTTFVSFNNLAKLTPQVIKVWSRILLATSGSRLIIKNRSMLCSEVRQSCLAMFEQESIDPDRLTLLGRVPAVKDHFAIYGQADIGLDPFPYNGTTTTCEALWMGVPVVVLSGDRHSSRVGASLLSQIGLEELIAKDVDEYIEKAVSLANSRTNLDKLRQGMRHRLQTSPLCDSQGFAKSMEEAFRNMWREWCSVAGGSSRENAEEAIERGIALHQAGRLDGAVEWYTKSLQLQPENSAVLCNLGFALTALGRLDEAVAALQKAVLITPGFPEAHCNLGNVLSAQEKLPEAVVSYQKAIEIKPDYAQAHSNLANVLSKQGDFATAVVSYQKAISINPDYAEAHSNLGVALKEQGRLTEAIASYQRALSINPSQVEALKNLGNAFIKQEQLDEALQALQSVLKIEPGDQQTAGTLIDILNYQMPKAGTFGIHAKAQESMQQIKLEYIDEGVIADKTVQQLYQQCLDILTANKLHSDRTPSQIKRGVTSRILKQQEESSFIGCENYMAIFEKFNIIPEFCFGCYKVVIEPRDVVELFKLMVVFYNIELTNDNSRKCMVELRPAISGTYKGFVYCNSIAQGEEILDIVKQEVGKRVSPDIPISLKRGCSEYKASYPDYSRVGDSVTPGMEYNEEWRKYEDYRDETLHRLINPDVFKTHNHTGFTIHDALVMRTWLSYAVNIDDLSYQKICRSPDLVQLRTHSSQFTQDIS
ncbi:MAG: tetratricopeptide repeat protein [Magnetococcales bacterium]|nr:tetratricopeptide repeat protein [Magnetococcales bacterium]